MTKRRKQPQEPAGSPKRPAWYWPITLSGWVAAALVWTLELPAKVNEFYEQKDRAWHHLAPARANPSTYIGRWTNDPSLRPDENLITDGSIPADQGTVQLVLHEGPAGIFSGEIETRLLESSIVPWSRVNVTGHIRWLGGLQGEVWDVVEGRHRTIAFFELTPSPEFGGQTLRFMADPSFSRLVPSETTLWRTDATMSDGRAGSEFQKVLMDVVKKHQ